MHRQATPTVRLPVALGLLAAVFLSSPALAAGPAVQAEPVASAPEDQAPQRLAVSPDGLHIAFVSRRGSRQVVIIDGKPSPRYDEIGHTNWANNREIVFSNDGKHVMFVARKGDQNLVVVDGNELPGSYPITDQFSFSPDGSQNAFVGEHDVAHSGYVAVVNGKESESYYKVENLQFSSNSKHIAYSASVMDPSKRAINVVVMDGKKEPNFVTIRNFAFSADGNHWAYIGDDQGNVDPSTPNQKSHLMVDGKETAVYEKIFACTISADGHVMYTASKGTFKSPQNEMLPEELVGLDGQVFDIKPGYRIPNASAGVPGAALLSPDGKRAAWIETTGSGANNLEYVSVNGKHMLDYKVVQNVTFSPDSQHIAFVATQSDGTIYVDQDDNEYGPYKSPPNAHGWAFHPIFSPDSRHLAFQAGDGHNAFVVEDGKPQGAYATMHGAPAFTADDRLVYFAEKDTLNNLPPIQRQQAMQNPNFDQGRYLVVDGRQQPMVRTIQFTDSGPVFSPDGKHIAYSDNNNTAIDGKILKPLPHELIGQAGPAALLTFTADSLHILSLHDHYFVDGDEVAGYRPAPINSYKPVLQPDGTIFFFGTRDGESAPPGGGPGSLPTYPPLYRVTVNPGPPRDFGTTGAMPIANSPAASPQNPAPANAGPQGTPQQPNPQPPQQARGRGNNSVQNQINRANNAASQLRGLLGR